MLGMPLGQECDIKEDGKEKYIVLLVVCVAVRKLTLNYERYMIFFVKLVTPHFLGVPPFIYRHLGE